MSAELKPCPFCGTQQVKPQAFDAEEGSSIRCMSCGGSTDHYVDADSAAEAWNTRPQPRLPTPMGWSDTDFLALGNPIPLRIFRKAVMRFKVMAELGVDVESMPMHFMKSQEKYAADVIEANRLLALIDSQRDAAPGVGNG